VNLAKKIETGTNWKLIAIPVVLVLFAALGGLAFWFVNRDTGPVTIASQSCLPGEVANIRANSSFSQRNPGNVRVYFDASGGMAGYVSQSPNAIGNLVTLSRSFVQSSLYPAGGAKVEFRRFGTYRFDPQQPAAPALVADPADFARPATFTEQESRIADVLRWVAHDRKGIADPSARPLSVLVTDLMLDDRAAIDNFEASVGGLLRNMMIEDGLAVGIMAVRIPFNGKIFIGPASYPAAMTDRPMVILMIGSPYQVRSFYDYLDTSEQQPFAVNTPGSGRAFALFGLEPGAIALSDAALAGVSTGFLSRPSSIKVPGAAGIPTFTFTADKAKNKGGISIPLEANAGVRDFEVIGNEPLSESAVWKADSTSLDKKGCASGAAWLRVGSLPLAGWKKSGQTLTYNLDAEGMKIAGLDQPGLYMVQLVAGQRGIVENHPAAAWMTAWSMSNEDLAARLRGSRGAAGTGVAGLEPLRRILLTELRLPGNQAIKRSASQAIIETE
jgi:hypothetical protein